MELSRVKGLGPAKVEALEAAGIASVEDLAAVDLRKRPQIDGVHPDTLKAYKQRARQLLRSEGVPFEKAPYATATHAASAPTAQKAPPAKRGLFARLFRRP